MQNELAAVRGVLDALRAAIRRAFMIRGVAILVAAIAAAAVFSFALDWFLDLPLAVRAVHLAVTAVVLFVVARWALIRPLSTPLLERDLAEAVEHGAPELSDRLLSALDFEKRVSDPNEPESREQMAAVIRDAAAAARRMDAALLVDGRPVRRALTGAACAVAVLAAVALSAPDAFGLWLRRGLLLEGVAWPRRTHLELTGFPAEGPRIVTRGDDLRIEVLATGEIPPDVTLHYEELADKTGTGDPGSDAEVTFVDARRMYALDGESGRFAYDFRAVSSSFRVWVTGGDDEDRDPVRTVIALVPPRVASIQGRIVSPAYTGLPETQVTAAAFEALTGSRVELSITTNMPVSSAQIVHTDRPEPQPVAVGADGKSLTLSFDLTDSLAFHLALTAARGQTNRPDDDMFRIRAAEDHAPDLRVLYPPARLYRTPNGIVPVKYVAKDDLAVASVGLDLLIGSTPAAKADLFPVEGTQPPADRRRVDGYRPLDLVQFAGDKGPGLKAGDVLHLTLRTVDSNGRETLSSDLVIDVLSPEDFERRLSQTQGMLREELQVVRRTQQRARTAILDLRRAVAAGGAAPALEQARNVVVDQGRVTNDIAQFLNGIRKAFDAYVLDRVGGGPTIEKLIPIYHEFLAKPSDEEVFPAALYKEIVTQKRLDRLYDPDVVGALLDIQDLGDVAWSEAAPAVSAALTRFASDAAHDAAELERAERLATDLGQLLYEIDQRMQRWGELNLLIEMARDIRNTQDSLSKDPAGTKGLAPK